LPESRSQEYRYAKTSDVLAKFTELLATAIANAEGRADCRISSTTERGRDEECS
jgi:hypothetical protein